MASYQLLDPILDQGIRYQNYFEGRLLEARALREQQDANRSARLRLGRAIGEGILGGLDVTVENDGASGSPPVVRVAEGLALNREGDVIGLPVRAVSVSLSRDKPTVGEAAADFQACAGPPGNLTLPTGVGVYFLVMCRAAGFRDRAPLSGLGDEGVVKGCGSRYVQEGVRFRLVELSPSKIAAQTAETATLLSQDLLSPQAPVQRDQPRRLSLLRNVLAHLCFGSEANPPLSAFPEFSALQPASDPASDAVEQLRAEGKLDDGDVPLAMLYWALDGIGFLDTWSVRRRVHRRGPTPGAPLLGADARTAVGEAMIHQFQAHFGDVLAASSNPRAILAADHFRHLPPAGVLPLADDSRPDGIDWQRFFERGGARAPILGEGARLGHMLAEAVHYPAIRSDRAELIWLYRLRQSAQATEGGPPAPTESLVFTTGYAPFHGHAQFNLARAGFANFEPAIRG